MFLPTKMLAFLLISLVLTGGCASTPVIKPDFIGADQKIEQDRVRQAAQTAPDIQLFASRIYAKNLAGDPHETTVDSVDSSKATPSYDEKVTFMGVNTGNLPIRTHLNIFKTYCAAKNGTLYRWLVLRDDYAYFRVRGTSREFFTCEINNKVEASLVFEVYTGSSKPNLPYITKTTFIDGARFSEYMESNRLFGWQSANSMITIPGYVIAEPASGVPSNRSQYSFFFNFKNNDSVPREINMLNSSVQLKGKEYAVDYAYARNPIHWTSYSWGEKNVGVFVGEEGKKLTKMRFNPGQEMSGHVLIKIPGGLSLNEGDMANFVFNLDGNKAQNFNKTAYYEMFKAPLKE